RHGNREGLARVLLAPLTEVQGAAAVAEPAHDHLVAADHLLAIDTQILAILVRSTGDHQPPGNQRAGIAGPAGLYRDARQVDIVALDDGGLAGRIAYHLRRHGDHLLHQRQLGPGVLEPLRRVGFLEVGQQSADLVQLTDALGTHAHGDRSGVPNRLPSTGMSYPVGFSNSSAGPPRRRVRSQTSVISSTGETGVWMR